MKPSSEFYHHSRRCAACRLVLKQEYLKNYTRPKGHASQRSRKQRVWPKGPTPYQLQNYIPVPESGCWLWLGKWNPHRYGQVKHSKRVWLAHRVFYEAKNGPIPPGMLACHKCDTPACVNPDHIFIGTSRDNALDKIRKGRANLKRRKATLLRGDGKGEGVSTAEGEDHGS